MTWPTNPSSRTQSVHYGARKLGELISFEKGKKMAIDDDGEPYIGIDGLRTNQYAVYTRETKGVRCKPDDVLLVWDGAHAGTVGTGLSGFVGSTIVKVLHENSLENKFLFYLLKLFQEKIRAAAQGAAIPHLSKAFVNNLIIPLPPLVTQKQIVERLDKIAEAQKLNDGLIQKSDELFDSIFHQEFQSKNDKWENIKLEEVCEKIEQINPRAIFKDSFFYIDIASIDKEHVVKAQIILVKNAPSRARKLVRTNDTIFSTVRPYLKHIAFIPATLNGSIASTGFCVIRPKTNIADPCFISYVVNSDYFVNKILPFQRGASYPAVSDTDIYNQKIAFPSLKEQRQIVAKLSAVQDYKKQLLGQKTKLKELFDSALAESMDPRHTKS